MATRLASRVVTLARSGVDRRSTASFLAAQVKIWEWVGALEG